MKKKLYLALCLSVAMAFPGVVSAAQHKDNTVLGNYAFTNTAAANTSLGISVTYNSDDDQKPPKPPKDEDKDKDKCPPPRECDNEGHHYGQDKDNPGHHYGQDKDNDKPDNNQDAPKYPKPDDKD